MEHRSGKVLVLGCDSRSGLAVVRSLGRAGLVVDIAWVPPGSLAPRSRYVGTVRTLPAWRPPGAIDDDAWKTALIGLVIAEGYDLVIPCNDRALIPLQRHKDELARHGRFYTLSDDAFTACFDKYHTTLLAARLGIRLPPWTLVERPEDLAKVGADWSLPLVLKPLSSFDLTRPAADKRGVRKLYDRAALPAVAADMLGDGPLLIQANFSGSGVGVELLAEDGRVLTAFQHQRVHEPLHGGGSSYRRSVPLDPALADAAERLAQALAYTGVMMVEFRVNPATNDWILVEINGRFWGSLPLAVAAGADFPRYLHSLLVEGRRAFPARYRVGIHCRNLSLDLAWLVKNLRADRSDPTLQTRPLWRVAAEIRHLVTLSERNDTLTLDDPAPGLAEIRDLADLGWRRSGGRLLDRLRVLPVWRRAAARRAVERFAAARTVLFVCKGNICRSPLAELYARRVLPADLTVHSAGYYPEAGRPSPPQARAAAARLGLDLDGHRSRLLDGVMVAGADVVVVFDADNRHRLAHDFPGARGRLVDLGALLPEGPLDIADPWSGDAIAFDHCYGRIRLALDRLAAALPARQAALPAAITPAPGTPSAADSV